MLSFLSCTQLARGGQLAQRRDKPPYGGPAGAHAHMHARAEEDKYNQYLMIGLRQHFNLIEVTWDIPSLPPPIIANHQAVPILRVFRPSARAAGAWHFGFEASGSDCVHWCQGALAGRKTSTPTHSAHAFGPGVSQTQPSVLCPSSALCSLPRSLFLPVSPQTCPGPPASSNCVSVPARPRTLPHGYAGHRSVPESWNTLLFNMLSEEAAMHGFRAKVKRGVRCCCAALRCVSFRCVVLCWLCWVVCDDVLCRGVVRCLCGVGFC